MSAPRAANEEIATTCPYCGVGCGVLARRDPDTGLTVRGDPAHPANFGRLCSKGSALGDTLALEGRLLHPQVEGRQCDWSTALDAVADGFRRVIDRHGPQAVAFYVSGQLLTEDYYVANKLMKGFIGAANIDTNSRLCMASSVAGHKRAFGADIVPGCYEDLESADLIVLVGSNAAWCHPVAYQRIAAAKQRRPGLKVVVIDPRRTATCDIADLHLPLRPGTDAVMFNGLLSYLHQRGLSAQSYIAAHTEGLEAALAAARAAGDSVAEVAVACGVDTLDLATFYRWFGQTENVVTAYSQGVNQSTSGTDKVNAIINCHLVTGRVGRPGMGPFSLTGQPNAMGGREVGGLSNQLAAQMEIGNPAHRALVQRFWRSPRIAQTEGLKAVELFDAIARDRIKAVWIMATNPVVSLPDADRVQEALRTCDLVVVSDCERYTDTTAHANILLPALAWGEKDGTVTNSERRISRQRAFLPAPDDARPDWWIICEVAKRMGFSEGFNYRSPLDIFREHAALTGTDNGGTRGFDIGELAKMSDSDYAQMTPIQWPVTQSAPTGTQRMLGNGRFFTPSGRARFVSVHPRPPANATTAKHPLVLNTGRVRDQWHTMTRTSKSARLSAHTVEPYAELHPDVARRYGICEGDIIRVRSHWGQMLARAYVTATQRTDSVFVPMHWTAQSASWGRVDALVNPATDPVSGQPESKHTPVSIELYRPAWYGFVLSRRELRLADAHYWVKVRGQQFWRYELAGDQVPQAWDQWARELLCAPDVGVGWVDYLDVAAGRYRGARLIQNRLDSCVFVAPTRALPERNWLGALFGKACLSEAERASLLAGQPGMGQSDAGRTVCACYGVGLNTLTHAVKTQGLTSVEAIGDALKAGTNCGSCIPELKALLRDGE